MLVTVNYDRDQLGFELPEGQVVGVWLGPPGLAPDALTAAVARALLEPEGYPPVGRMVVPGDRVTLAVDPSAEGFEIVLKALAQTLRDGGVEPDDVTIITPPTLSQPDFWRPQGSTAVVHDPSDPSQIAYLATTTAGRRIYLSRSLTDADLVIPVAGVRPAAGGSTRGPAHVIFPDLSNHESRIAAQAAQREAKPARKKDEDALEESVEASGLLGSRFHVALVPAANGVLEVIAGRDDLVHQRGVESFQSRWRFEAPGRADLVVAGVGSSREQAMLSDLALALATAVELVDRGGRIIILSKAGGAIGPALGRLIGADLPRGGQDSLRGAENEPDYPTALAFARATAWADVFLASALDPQTVEDLGMTPLERPEQARRLAAQAHSCTLLSRAELTRAHAIS